MRCCWQGKPEWVREADESLSDRPLAFHKYKAAGTLEYMNDVIYGDGRALRQYDHAVGRKSYCRGPKTRERCGNLTLTKRYLRQVRHRLRQGAPLQAAAASQAQGSGDLAARVSRLEDLVSKLQGEVRKRRAQ